jgi:hypothetical protein
VVVSNVIAALEGRGSEFYQSEYLTMYEAGFRNVYTFPRGSIGSRISMNIIMVATQEERRLAADEVVRIARDLRRRREHPVRVRRFVERAGRLSDGPFTREEAARKMPRGVRLTDDYCPVDTMYFDR